MYQMKILFLEVSLLKLAKKYNHNNLYMLRHHTEAVY